MGDVAMTGGPAVFGDVVDVWQVDSRVAEPVVARLAGLLDESERARCAAHRDPALCRDYVVAHGMVRLVLGRRLAVDPAALRFCAGRHGKPALPGDPVRFNLSHSGSAVLLAVTADREIGVDVEQGRPGQPWPALAERFFGPDEQAAVRAGGATAYLRVWTRMEACVKAAGGQLLQGRRLAVGPGGDRVVTGDPRWLPGVWRVRQLGAPAGQAAAVALAGDAPFRVRRHRVVARC